MTLLATLAYLVRRPISQATAGSGAATAGPAASAVPVGMTMVLVGLLLVVTRRHAVSQLVGFLMVDNGIATVAFLTAGGVPLVVELGASLDVLLVVLVLQVLTGRIRTSSVTRPRRPHRAVRLMSLVVLPAVVRVSLLLGAVAAFARGARGPHAWSGGVALDGRARWRGRAAAPTLWPVPTALGGLLRVDALSAFMVALIGAVGLTATWGGLARRWEDVGRARTRLWSCSSWGAMTLALVADNLGVVWVAVEATTIATAFLVGHHRSRRGSRPPGSTSCSAP